MAILCNFLGSHHITFPSGGTFFLPPAAHGSQLPSSSLILVFCLFEKRWACALLTMTILRAEPPPPWPLPPFQRHHRQSLAGLRCTGPLPSLSDISLGWATSMYSHGPRGHVLANTLSPPGHVRCPLRARAPRQGHGSLHCTLPHARSPPESCPGTPCATHPPGTLLSIYFKVILFSETQ